MSSNWHTAWQNQDIVVFKGDTAVDRLPGQDIKRVIFVYLNRGESPGDLLYAAVEMPQDWVLLPAESGFAGRVNFERQKFWEAHHCVYWINVNNARLPTRFRRSRWLLPTTVPPYARVPIDDMGDAIDQWTLEGPETWEQRKWMRIQRSRPFTSASAKATPPRA